MMDLRTNEGFAAFYAEQRPRLENIAYRMTGDRHLAEDIVNNAAIRVWQRCQRELPDQPVAFLVRAVQNEARDHFRRRARRPRTTTLLPTHEGRFATNDTGASAIDDRDELAQLLPLLPDRQRTALELRYLHGLTDGEIAEQLGMALPTVRSNVHRALERLRLASSAAGPGSDAVPSRLDPCISC